MRKWTNVPNWRLFITLLFGGLCIATASKAVSVGKPHHCSHAYPADLATKGIEGTVELGFTVTAQRMVEDEHVVASSSNAELDDAAVACAQYWKYKPATQEGLHVAVLWRAKVKFRLSSKQPPAITAEELSNPVEIVVVFADN